MKSPSQILPDIRRERFLEELAQHREDSPHPKSLGDEETIATAFNTYAMERRNRNHRIVATVTFAAVLFPFLAVLTSANNIDAIDVWWEAFIIIPAFLFIIPTVPFALLGGLLPQALDTNQLLIVTPVITGLTWATMTYLFLNPPKKLARYFGNE